MTTAPINITALKALDDNYIWVLDDNSNCIVVDPGDAKPVIHWLKKSNMTLQAILITHRHWDHTHGIPTLKPHLVGPIIGPDSPMIPCDVTLADQQTLDLTPYLQTQIPLILQAISTPGHTHEHLCYLIDNKHLFTGDTLFSAGCGRTFDGTAKQLYQSIKKLTALEDDTLIYCGHEYTLNNLKFALTLEPNNRDLHEHFIWAKNKNEINQCTLPSTLAKEKKINPFLRTQHSSIKKYVSENHPDTCSTPADIFDLIRQLKDQF